jgi:hypothetical protein
MKRSEKGSFLLKILAIIVFLWLFPGCSEAPFDGTDYNSFALGNEYRYSGMSMKMSVDSSREADGGWEFIVVYRDSSDAPLIREVYWKKEKNIWWKEFDASELGWPILTFDPPIIASPFSGKAGQIHTHEGYEIRRDARRSKLRIRVDSVMEGFEDVQVPAGTFPACLREKVTYSYVDSTDTPYLAGEARWWFARGVGAVKFQMPEGDGELLSAKIYDRILPDR